MIKVVLFPAQGFQKQNNTSCHITLLQEKGKAALTGFTIYLTYTLVLTSMSFVSNVSYVVAFRQLSIPIGTTIAIVFLKEKGYLPRLTGTLLMFLGLVLVGTA